LIKINTKIKIIEVSIREFSKVELNPKILKVLLFENNVERIDDPNHKNKGMYIFEGFIVNSFVF